MNSLQLKRRELYKDNEDLRKGEIEKMRQDFFLDRLKCRLYDLTEQNTFCEAQIREVEEELVSTKNAITESQSKLPFPYISSHGRRVQ